MITDWDELLRERRRFELAQYADSTNLTRSVQIKAYLEFCEKFSPRIQPYPCDSEQICLYVCYLARRLTFCSIRNYISALSNHLKDLDLPPVDYSNHSIKKLLMGVKRLKGDSRKQASPLLPENLLRLFGGMTGSYAHTSVRAAMLVSFRALLRKGHVTYSDNVLLRKDIVFHEWGMMLMITRSKTNQYRERIHYIPVSKVRGNSLCAVFWTSLHFKQCPAPPEAVAFRLPRRGHSVPMTYGFYSQVIKLMCVNAALDEHEFSSHSLRRGGATFLRMCGATIQDIKERGDWKSNAVFEYLKLSVSERLDMDMRFALYLST